jgi:hypothetical protein|tara:strand:- start:176 stop:568 length:393 start_codon:yes stop_codon:yes gene_type:complete
MDFIKTIIKVILSFLVLGIVLWVTYEVIFAINEGHGEFFRDMNEDGEVTYKDFFVRILFPAGTIVLNVINPILDSDLGKFFELSSIANSNKSMVWSGLFFYLLLIPTCISIVGRFLFYVFGIEEDFWDKE